MATKIFIPKMGASIESTEIGKVYFKMGDIVKKGDILFEMVTDKATFNVEADSDGKILSLNLKEGDTRNVLDTVGFIGSEIENIDLIAKDRVFVTPAAKKIANDNGLDLDKIFKNSIKPIKEEDVLNYLRSLESNFEIKKEKIGPKKRSEIQALSKSQDCLNSAVAIQISSTKIKEKLKKCNEDNKINLGIGEFITYQTSKILEKFPKLNAFFENDEINYYQKINIGFAVGIDEDLFVPIIKDADKLNIVDFSSAFKEAVVKVIKNEITPNELQGGTFTITDLSSQGVFFFIPIINSKQSAILGICSEYSSLLLEEKIQKIESKINLVLSFDHRVLNGKLALEFLNELKRILEN